MVEDGGAVRLVGTGADRVVGAQQGRHRFRCRDLAHQCVDTYRGPAHDPLEQRTQLLAPLDGVVEEGDDDGDQTVVELVPRGVLPGDEVQCVGALTGEQRGQLLGQRPELVGAHRGRQSPTASNRSGSDRRMRRKLASQISSRNSFFR